MLVVVMVVMAHQQGSRNRHRREGGHDWPGSARDRQLV
jgi:hypothetical protein